MPRPWGASFLGPHPSPLPQAGEGTMSANPLPPLRGEGASTSSLRIPCREQWSYVYGWQLAADQTTAYRLNRAHPGFVFETVLLNQQRRRLLRGFN